MIPGKHRIKKLNMTHLELIAKNQRIKELFKKSDDELKSYLYQTQKFYFINDLISEGNDNLRPFYLNLTVDEISTEMLRYLGDDNSKYQALALKKKEQKEYIRNCVMQFKGAING